MILKAIINGRLIDPVLKTPVTLRGTINFFQAVLKEKLISIFYFDI